MAEISLMWGGITIGDAGPYTDDQFSDMLEHLFIYDRNMQGVLPSAKAAYLNNLLVSCPGGAAVRVRSGAALVDGKLYLNDGNVDFTVAAATTYYVVGLQKDFAAQTVRAFMRGTYASRALALASLVHTDAVIWEIPLATVLTTAGSIVDVITDERIMIRPDEVEVFIPSDIIYNDTAGTWHGAIGLDTNVFDVGQREFLSTFWLVPNNYHSGLAIYLYSGAAASDVVTQNYWGRKRACITQAFAAVNYTGVLACGENIVMNPTGVEPGDVIVIYYSRDALDPADLLADNLDVYGIVIRYTPYYAKS